MSDGHWNGAIQMSLPRIVYRWGHILKKEGPRPRCDASAVVRHPSTSERHP